MLKGQPVHGMWCSAALKKTECGFCEKPVFLFFCDCGCMVMLEEFSGANSVHACREVSNRFSGRDVFLISRTSGKKIDPDCLTGALVDGKPVRVDMESCSAAPGNMARGDVVRVSASFYI